MCHCRHKLESHPLVDKQCSAIAILQLVTTICYYTELAELCESDDNMVMGRVILYLLHSSIFASIHCYPAFNAEFVYLVKRLN